MLQHIFRGRRSAWFPLLTVCCFIEFDTSVICPAMLMLCLGSFLLQALALQGKRVKYSVNMLLTCIPYCDAGPSYLIRTVCKHSALHKYHIYLRPAFLQRLP